MNDECHGHGAGGSVLESLRTHARDALLTGGHAEYTGNDLASTSQTNSSGSYQPRTTFVLAVKAFKPLSAANSANTSRNNVSNGKKSWRVVKYISVSVFIERLVAIGEAPLTS